MPSYFIYSKLLRVQSSHMWNMKALKVYLMILNAKITAGTGEIRWKRSNCPQRALSLVGKTRQHMIKMEGCSIVMNVYMRYHGNWDGDGVILAGQKRLHRGLPYVEDPVLSLLWLRSLLRHGLDPWPRNLYMP